MDEITNLINKWLNNIQLGEPLQKREDFDYNKRINNPPSKIEEFNQDLFEKLVSTLSFTQSNENFPLSEWLEKVRRYIEINRPNLWKISCKRFGSAENAQLCLERMVCLLAIYAYDYNDILLFNATCNGYDSLNVKFSSKNWKQQNLRKIIVTVVSNPSRYVEFSNEA
ncbi:MAG: hypothetical protein R3D86_04350 [Emcibacteraceae bacterium]